jgi:hypothetical protein
LLLLLIIFAATIAGIAEAAYDKSIAQAAVS